MTVEDILYITVHYLSELRRHRPLEFTLSLNQLNRNPTSVNFMLAHNPQNHLTHQQRLQQNVRNLIVKNMLPFRIVEDQAFRKIFEDAPMLEPPFANRKQLKKNIQDDFITTREALKGELKETCSSISLSVDVWTSPNQLSILGVVGHWLTPNFEYKEKLLEFAELPESESGDDMALMLDGTLVELGLEEKLVAITGQQLEYVEEVGSVLSHLSAFHRRRLGLLPAGSQSPPKVQKDDGICIAGYPNTELHSASLLCTA